MDVPKNAGHVGWYQFGPKPGEQGSAVIAGHLDTVSSKPAIFWDLKTLKPNDNVYVQDNDGTLHQFRVKESTVYDYAHAPLEEIFGQKDGRHLNLITCNGVWNEKKGTYNERTVVYTDAIPSAW